MTSSISGGRAHGAGALIAVAVLLLLAGVVGALDGGPEPEAGPGVGPGRIGETSNAPTPAPGPEPRPRYRIFGHDRTLVAYYGTAGTGSLGVLGEGPPDRVIGRLEDAAQAFRRPGRPVQIVYELIVTIADPVPGPDDDYSHDLARSQVERYLRAAYRHDALLLLDLQPGRDDFLDVARRWAWALRDPRVGLALDPEWRMGRGEVPGRVIGSVDAVEVNEVSLWLANLVRSERLPQKLFVLHEFRTSMIERIDRVAVRDLLATVQHVDGYGTREQKLATYHAVLEPKKFYPGLKLFYDEDVRLMRPADVLRIKPRVRFVSYQ
ncbi:hypothetical protein BH09ACT12_BH09ACT12_32990 [soil metagenome]